MGREDINLIRRELKEGKYTAFKRVYQAYKAPFRSYCLKKNLGEQDIMEVYNDLMMVFHDNLVNNKLTELTSTLKTYLFGIGRILMYNKYKIKANTAPIDSLQDMVDKYAEESSSRKEELSQAILTLGKSCQEILILFYYRKYSIYAIQQRRCFKTKIRLKHTSRDV